MTTPIAIRRGDSFGYQLAVRMIAQVLCDQLNIPYVHNKLPVYKKHNMSQQCVDYMYKTVTGQDNTSHDGDAEYFTGWSQIIKSKKPDEPCSPLFSMDQFDRFKTFASRNKQYRVLNSERFNITIHIRRGDVQELECGRCMSDESYIDMIDSCVEKYAEHKDNMRLYIETDSPLMVQSLATKYNAFVNKSSSYVDELVHNPPSTLEEKYFSEWSKCVYVLQSLYNIATADVFVPSRSSFSVLGGIIGHAEIFSQRFKKGRIKNPDLFFPVTKEYLNIPADCTRLQHDAIWLHYLPLVNVDTIKFL